MKKNKQEWDFEIRGTRKNIFKKFILFLLTILNSLNPDSYNKFESKKVSESYNYLLNLVIFCILISSFFAIPHFFSQLSQTQSTISKIETLKFNPEIKTNETIDLGFGIIINKNAKNITTENILITSEKVYKKPTICFFSNELCTFYEKKTKEYKLEEFFDIKNRSSEIINFIKIILTLLLPFVLILFIVYYFIRYAIITFFVALIAYLLLLIKKKVSFISVLKISIHSCTIMVILEIIGRYYYTQNIFIKLIPLGIYLLLFAIGNILMIWKIDF
ncbi:MAG: DUF1189 family protein [Candidatus Woesearchaeota archaeon]